MNCHKWINEYERWFNQSVQVKESDSGCIIETPFLSIDNDYLTVRIQERNDDIIIGDNHYTMEYLFLHDYDLDNERIKSINRILNGLNLQLEKDELIAKTTITNFGRMFLNLIQGINNISSLTNTIRATEQKTFKEEIKDYLTEQKVIFTQNYKITGQASEHFFDFMVVKNDQIVIEPLSTKSVSAAKRFSGNLAFKILDIKQAGITNIKSLAILDDTHEEVWENVEVKKILDNYVDDAYKWKKERNLIKDLVA